MFLQKKKIWTNVKNQVWKQYIPQTIRYTYMLNVFVSYFYDIHLSMADQRLCNPR